MKAKLGLAIAFGSLLGGCWNNVSTEFPEGLDPWEENLATLPEAVEGDACPETLTLVNTAYGSALSVHAKGCIHQPLATVWRSIRDPQVGRDPTTTDGFGVIEYDSEPEYDYSYKTAVHITHAPLQFDFHSGWRHSVVTGTDDAPARTASRWQKVWGTELFSTMEGSIVMEPLASDPSITVVAYQYHLGGSGVSHENVRGFLTVIFGRLKDRSHGIPLMPNDCGGCPQPPERY